MNSNIAEHLRAIRESLQSVGNINPPNEPIADYLIPDRSIVDGWLERLESLSEGNLIEGLTRLLSEIDLPSIESEPRYEHLVIYHSISKVRELTRNALSEAISLGYPHALNVIAQTNDIAPDLNVINGALERIEAQVGVIQR